MRLTDVWNSRGKPTISFEFFPGRNEKAVGKLDKVIDKLAALEPDFVSVTFGAGGSTRDGSRELVEKLMHEKRLAVLPYFAGYGLGPDDLTAILADYRDLGTENLLAVRGDAPQGDVEFVPHPESLPHASDLLAFIKERFDFCLGAGGYPEGHIEAESLDRDIEFVRLKVDQGAEFIITNYCFDNAYFFDFRERCARAGIDVPIVPGVMPIYNVKLLHSLASLCGATITDRLQAGLAALPEGDQQAVSAFGVEFAVDQCRELLEQGVPGLHFYTIDRAKSVLKIVGQLRESGLV